jgi:hypothetical protein
MTNLSLARIMYGTHEDFHTAGSMQAPGYSSLTAQAGREKVAGTGHPATLRAVLHKAWVSLTGRD